jgi:2-amino-4-hydroxy-6-hydroxymethyldihydropteridine diphosphokinase
MSMDARAFIGVGSNIEPERFIPKALELLAAEAPLIGISTFYRTAPIGRPEQDWYLNGVVAIRWQGDAGALKFDVLRTIEIALGRVRGHDLYAPRCIDLDLLILGDTVSNAPGLILPDPEICERTFLLAGLLELDKQLILPDSERPLAAWASVVEEANMEGASAFTQHLKERFLRNE